MITLKTLQWDNCFSYGEGNTLQLDEVNLTQLVGTNGQGKSSIPLILEEVLFNKNSKGIKKQEIQNRFINKGYHINLTFTVDAHNYEIDIIRKAGIKCKLYKEGKDISSHTATNTYKTVQNLLGLDFKTFTQLVYQNTNMSLQFLTATDTNRKKFLIELLKMEEYVEFFEVFKAAARDIQLEVNKLNGRSDTIVNWLEKNKLESIDTLEIKNLPKYSEEDEEELQQLRSDFEKISEKNKKIVDNNFYKQSINRLEEDPDRLYIGDTIDLDAKSETLGTFNANLLFAEEHLDKLSDLSGNCPTCEQSINKDMMNTLRKNYELIQKTNENHKNSLMKEIEKARFQNAKVIKKERLQTEFEEVVRLWDGSLPSTILDAEDISYQIDELSSKISNLRESIERVSRENMRRERHNTRIDIIQEQTREFEDELEGIVAALGKVEEKATYLEILKKAFSTNGLLAYKIENLVKDLEQLTNEYLAELSDGRFSLGFVVTNDKLNVEITDNSKIVDILALSSGELARVNTSTLLAIRKLMSSISSSRINTLFLDEVIAVLDDQGREKLVEILLQEITPDKAQEIAGHNAFWPILNKEP